MAALTDTKNVQSQEKDMEYTLEHNRQVWSYFFALLFDFVSESEAFKCEMGISFSSHGSIEWLEYHYLYECPGI
jgi:hypothetical protein